jgi:beta-propeller repeat-containing protein
VDPPVRHRGGDNARDVTVDETNRLLVAGSTEGALPGQVSGEGFDAFVASFDTDGRTLWIRQFGSTGDDFGVAVAADAAGNVFVAGSAGETLSGRPSPGGRTAFLRQYDPTGVALWTDQFDTGAADDAWDVAVAGEGTAYLVGATGRALPGQRAAGRIDAFVRQYGPGGSEVWTRQYGTPEDDYGLAVAVDQDRGVVIAGSTRGALDDRSHGNLDAYALRLVGPSNQ